ncbi:hypothetical protein [Halomonas sp. hl-4]|uniref:hypothetical protein n=1 Tax=Halomonas sp. hl-4 TaxID=1761789 RepID=UPI000BB710B5|nr:hypothetical protein [Halomonas sp. hl-4]SNY95587.1 hypothetical protein SAMN04488142_0088 [Halomonas sp. hl-4]
MYQNPCTLFLFNEHEKRKILFSRSLIEYRTGLGVLVGLMTTIAVFFIQYPWSGQQSWMHSYAAYGAFPAGIAAGLYAWHAVEWRDFRQWEEKWLPTAIARSGGGHFDINPLVEPMRFSDRVDKHIAHLNATTCSLIFMLAGYVAIFSLSPLLLQYAITRWVFVFLMLSWWLIAAFLGHEYASKRQSERSL